MPRYYGGPNGGFATASDGPLAAPSLPEGWEEITAEEYAARETAARQAADALAAEFIANDGEIPPQDGEETSVRPPAEPHARLTSTTS